MEQIVVYTLNGNVRSQLRNRASGCALVNAEIEAYLMASDTVRVSVESIESIAFTVGDYIVIDGMKYRMNQAPQVVRDHRELFVYTLVFESAKYDLMNCMFLLPDSTRDDYFTATLSELAQMVVDNANRVYAGQWTMGECPDRTEVITEQFTEQNCLVALQSICEAFDLQFRITEENDIKTVNIIERGDNTSLNLEYGRGNGLYSIQREATTSEEIITRLFVYGSSENLPTGYPHTRLCLPYSGSDPNVNRRNVSYIENASKIDQFGLKEGIVIFEDEKPHCKSEITQIFTSDRCKFGDTNIDFDILAYWQSDDFTEFCTMRGYDPNDATVQQLFADDIVGKERKYIVDGHATITFNTGNLAGYSFQLDDYDAETHVFTIHPITLNEGDEILERTIPDADSEAFQFAVGDEYVISDIIMPYELVNDPTTAQADTPKGAEQRLANRANGYYEEHSKVCARYSIVFDRIYLMRNHSGGLRVACGDYIHIKDTKLGIDSWIKVTRYYRNLLTDEVTVDISDIKPRNPNTIWSELSGENADRVFEDMEGNVVLQPTTLTCVFTPNYNTEADTYDMNTVSVSDGIFTNTTLTGRKRVWRLYDRIKSDFTPKYEYDVFVKASKRTQDAQIYFEPVLRTLVTSEPSNVFFLEQRQSVSLCRRDDNYYYFKIGKLSKPSRRYSTQRYARTLTLEYGDVNLPASSVVGGDIHIIDADGNVVIDSATRTAYLDNLTALYGNTRINVGTQAGRVTLIIDDSNYLRAARIADSLIVSRMLSNNAVTSAKLSPSARFAREQLSAHLTFENDTLKVVAGEYNNSIIGDISIESDELRTDKDGNPFDSVKQYFIYVDAESNKICLSAENLSAEDSFIEIGVLSEQQTISGDSTRVIALRPVSTVQNDTVPIDAHRINGGTIRDNSGRTLVNLSTGEIKFSRSNGGIPVSIRDIDTIVGADANSGLRKSVSDLTDEVNDQNTGITALRNAIMTIKSKINGISYEDCAHQTCSTITIPNLPWENT